MSRTTLIAANWKMNGDISLVASMSAALKTAINPNSRTQVLICPPATLLAGFTGDRKFALGAQNLNEQASGAYTGELSAAMLKASGCDYVLVGHSERREIYLETSHIVSKKFIQATRSGLRPILCVGEKLADRESGATKQVLAEQIDAVLEISEPADWQTAVIAYEPVWAIGTGKTATPEMAQETHEFLRSYLASKAQTANIAPSIQILYGGSMKAANAAELLSQSDIDGGLVGGASLDPESFVAIIAASQ